MNKWTKMLIAGWFKNNGIWIILLGIVAGVSVIVSVTTPESESETVVLTTEEQTLLDKHKRSLAENNRRSNTELTSEEYRQVRQIQAKISDGPEGIPKPDPLTTEEYNVLEKYKKWGTDGETRQIEQRRGEARTFNVDPMSDEELTVLATAKDKQLDLAKWYSNNKSDAGALLAMMLIVPLFFVVMYVMMAFGSRTDLGRISQIRDMEKRMHEIRKHGAENFIEKSKAILVDGNKEGVELYVTYDVLPKNNDRGSFEFGNKRPVKFVVYRDTSTKETYMSFVPVECDTANEAMAWKQRLTVKQYEKMVLQS
jgi:hypothetical protein